MSVSNQWLLKFKKKKKTESKYLVYRLHFTQFSGDGDFFLTYKDFKERFVMNRGWNGQRVSTGSYVWRRKITT